MYGTTLQSAEPEQGFILLIKRDTQIKTGGWQGRGGTELSDVLDGSTGRYKGFGKRSGVTDVTKRLPPPL